ncbi:MAG TPA: hypothetical protein VK186_25440 [Candidatus Deferrimicrobium sp.]|nr:hypothetical protein [Candidatus Deferrimicrobium sp.]
MAKKGDRQEKAISDYVRSLVKNDVRKFINFLDKMLDRDYASGEPEFEFKTFTERFNADAFKEIAQKFDFNESLSVEEKKIINKFLRPFDMLESHNSTSKQEG